MIFSCMIRKFTQCFTETKVAVFFLSFLRLINSLIWHPSIYLSLTDSECNTGVHGFLAASPKVNSLCVCV